MEPLFNLGSFDCEIIGQIFTHLTPKNIFSAQLVCHKWHSTPSRFFWESYIIKAKNGELEGEAVYQLARIYFKAAKRDAKYYSQGLEILEQAAKCNHSKSLCEVAYSYLHTANWLGASNPSSPFASDATYRCLYNFKKAAELGNVEAQYQYGSRFLWHGVDSKSFLLLAAEKNHPSAQCQLGKISSTDGDTWLEKAILNGSNEAFIFLAQKKGINLPAWRDAMQLKLTLGFLLAKKLLPLHLHEQDRLKEILTEEYLFFAQFREVQLGFSYETKKALNSWENEEEITAYRQLKNKNRPAAINLAHFYMHAQVRDQKAILDCFKIDLQTICPDFSEYCAISLLPYFEFMDAWQTDPILPQIKEQLTQTIRSVGHDWAIAAFLADCFILFVDEEEIKKADVAWCEKRLGTYLNFDHKILLYFLFKLCVLVNEKAEVILLEQLKEMEQKIPFSELEKHLYN